MTKLQQAFVKTTYQYTDSLFLKEQMTEMLIYDWEIATVSESNNIFYGEENLGLQGFDYLDDLDGDRLLEIIMDEFDTNRFRKWLNDYHYDTHYTNWLESLIDWEQIRKNTLFQ